MSDRLKWNDHQTARQLGRLAGLGNAAARERLQSLVRRTHPELGERYLCPSGQTVDRLEDAVAAWAG